LHVGKRVEPIGSRHPPKRLHETLRDRLRVGGRDHEQVSVAFGARRGRLRQATFEDRVGTSNDGALLRLPEHFVKADRRADSRGDQVAKRLARTDRGKLIDVADQCERGVLRNRCKELRSEADVQHRGLVDEDEVSLEGQALVAIEVARRGVPLEKAVNRLGLDAGRLGESLRRAPRGRTQGHASFECCMRLNDRADGRGFAGSGSAREDHEMCAERGFHGASLCIAEGVVMGLDGLFCLGAIRERA